MNCQEAGALIEKEQFEQLSFTKRVGLRVHLLYCKCCKGYKKDVTRLNQIIKAANEENCDSSLCDEDKAAIKARLNAEG